MSEPTNREVAALNVALELRPAERAAYLDETCAGDPALRQRVEDLLGAYAAAEGFLEAPPPGLGATRTMRVTVPLTEKPGDKIGHYKLLQQIGEGGCGVVYMAEQEEPVRRRVALKVIKLGMDTKQVVARFDAERQALALMDHPNIAKVLEAGATDTGRPYFVMELVRGIKITQFCDENKASTEERLKLFIQVCQAIQHAHQKGIIHRDIKPSNILVTINDGVPVPKVIDFGIAKATQGRLTDQTLFTAFEQFIGTPAYMSPEQAVLTSLDIDTRSDIYSLGVLLYELLTGKTPFDQQELLAAGLDEMRRTIREKEPPKPSTRLTQELVAADVRRLHSKSEIRDPKSEEKLRASSRRLLQEVRGDLDWIVMKAMEKDRARRYETANGLARDIERHLNCEPVTARPPSRLYEFQKTVRRHKVGFAAAAVVMAVLAMGVLASTWQAIRATRAEREQSRSREAAQQAQANEAKQRQEAEADRRKAETEATKATAISDFLQQMLRSANPDDLKGSDYTVRQLLDDFSAGLTDQLASQPEVEATVRLTIGRAYYRLGLADRASGHLERALTLRRRIFGEQAEQVAEALKDCVWSSFAQSRHAQAELYAREALEIYHKRGGSGQPVISVLFALQRTLINGNRFAEADAISEEALAIARRSPSVEFPELASILHGFADVRNNQSRYAEAESLARKALEMHRRLHGAEHPETAWALLFLGIALRNQQKPTDAEATLRESVRIFSKYYSPGHQPMTSAMNELKAVLEAKGDFSGIAALTLENLEYANNLIGRKGADPEAWLERVWIEADLNDWKAAIQDYDEAIALAKDESAAKRMAVAEVCVQFAWRAERAAQPEFAERVARQAVVLFRQLARENPRDSTVRSDLAGALGRLSFLLREGRLPEAEATAREALAIRKELLGNEHPDVAQSLHWLAWNLNLEGKHSEAEALSREEGAMWRKLLGNDHPNVAWALGDLTVFLRDQGKLPEAETTIRESLEIRRKRLGDAHPDTVYSFNLLADLLRAQGKEADARTLIEGRTNTAAQRKPESH